MTLHDLVGKDISVTYMDDEQRVGKLENFDSQTNMIHLHVYHNNSDIFIPLFNVKSITEHY